MRSFSFHIFLPHCDNATNFWSLNCISAIWLNIFLLFLLMLLKFLYLSNMEWLVSSNFQKIYTSIEHWNVLGQFNNIRVLRSAMSEFSRFEICTYMCRFQTQTFRSLFLYNVNENCRHKPSLCQNYRLKCDENLIWACHFLWLTLLICRSLSRSCRTFWTLSSVFVVDGGPERSSSVFRPSRNLLRHPKVRFCNLPSSPKACLVFSAYLTLSNANLNFVTLLWILPRLFL